MSDPSSSYKFDSRDFLGDERDGRVIQPAIVTMDVTSALWRLWTKYWLAILITTLMGYFLPSVFAQRVLGLTAAGNTLDGFLSAPVAGLFSMIQSLWGVMACAYLTYFILAKEYQLSIDWQAYVQKTWPIFLVSVLLILGMILGFLLLIVPGIIFYCASIVALPLLLIDEEDPINAIRRSFVMTKGQRWTIFWASVAYTIILILCMFVVGLVVMPVFEAVGEILSFEEIGEFFDPIYDIAFALFPVAIYEGLRKLWRGDAPEQLASVFD